MCWVRPGSDPVVEPRTPLACWLTSSASSSFPVLGSVVVAQILIEMGSDLIPELFRIQSAVRLDHLHRQCVGRQFQRSKDLAFFVEMEHERADHGRLAL